MSIDNVKKYLKKWNKDKEIIEFEESSATVELAAKAIGCLPAVIAKSITFKIQERTILIVTSGETKVNNTKYKTQFAIKAKMLKPEEVIERVGHTIGGVCPFAVKDNVEIYLDESLRRFEYIYPACGSCNSVIKLSIKELEEYTNNKGWIDVCM